MSQERPKPYVGVSGVTAETQGDLVAMTCTTGLVPRRNLVLGVKAVHKTQFLDIENSYGHEWYPVGEEEFRHLRGHQDPFMNVAQMYFDKDLVFNEEYRNKFMAKVLFRGENWLRGVQFDLLPWHENESVFDVVEFAKRANMKVFLQCHKPAMEELGAKGVARKLGAHASQIDYLLFDSSHGTGTRLDASALEPFLETVSEDDKFDGVGLAVAGGLDARVVSEDLPALIGRYPDLSWDAEGRLHPVNGQGLRPLDMQIVEKYLRTSSAIVDLQAYVSGQDRADS